MRSSSGTRWKLWRYAAGAGLLIWTGGMAWAQDPSGPPAPVQTEQAPKTLQTPQMAETPSPEAPPSSPLANAPEPTGGAAAGENVAFGENMIGDLLYGTRSVSAVISRVNGNTNDVSGFGTSVTNPNIAENNNALPMVRVYFRYNYFHNAFSVQGVGSIIPGVATTAPPVRAPISLAIPATKSYDESLYTFGGEQTFFDGRASLELRVPFRTTLASKFVLQPGVPDGPAVDPNLGPVDTAAGGSPFFNTIETLQDTFGHEDTEWDNLTLIFKGLLYRDNVWAVSGGLGVTLPTAQDARVGFIDFLASPNATFSSAERFRQVTVKNDAVGLTPYLALLCTPTPRCFAQAFLQVDVPSNKNEVVYTDQLVQGTNTDFRPVSTTTRIADQDLLKADLAAGYWLRRDPEASWLNGIVGSLELHYTTTLNNAQLANLPGDGLVYYPSLSDFLLGDPRGLAPQPGPVVGNPHNRMDILDMTVGATFVVGDRLTIANGFAFPLRTGQDKVFDWEYLLEINWYFGHRSSGATNAMR